MWAEKSRFRLLPEGSESPVCNGRPPGAYAGRVGAVPGCWWRRDPDLEFLMSVQINHVLLTAHDREASAAFLANLLGRPAPGHWGPLTSVDLGDGVSVQYAELDRAELPRQHVAFLVTEAEFDGVYARLRESGTVHWADPHCTRAGVFNTNHGGRGVYFLDPGGHGLEVLTRPYTG